MVAGDGERQSVPYPGLAFLYCFCRDLFPDPVDGGFSPLVLSSCFIAGAAGMADLEEQEAMRICAGEHIDRRENSHQGN